MSEAPPFWFKKPGVASWLLSPLGFIYGTVATRRMLSSHRAVSKTPVLCIGNFIAGGAGKTPTAVAIARIARNMGLKPAFLSRGYGGSITQPTIVDLKTHNARDVGDEPLILAQYATTVVSPDRPAGAALLEQDEIDIILMDDGFQNPSLHKDYSLAVVDAGRGLGNGFCIPAGPMRARLKPQLAEASAILLIGKSEIGTQIVRKAAKMAKPILMAEVKARNAKEWDGAEVLAFSGIADPSKFHNSLLQCGAELVETRNFHDHHVFSQDDCDELIRAGKAASLQLVTTEKDHVRLIRMGQAQEELHNSAKVLYVDLAFENVKMVELIVRDTLKRATEFRLKNPPTL